LTSSQNFSSGVSLEVREAWFLRFFFTMGILVAFLLSLGIEISESETGNDANSEIGDFGFF
jgi:hypothetical protein